MSLEAINAMIYMINHTVRIAKSANYLGNAGYVDEDAWNDWLVGERERLSEIAIGALVQHGAHELAAGRAEAALRLGRRAAAFNKFREDAHRLVLRSLAATGRTAEAKKHFQDFAAYLCAELDTGPDEETRSLVLGLESKGGNIGASDPKDPAILGPSQSAAPAPKSMTQRQETFIIGFLPVVAGQATSRPEALDLAVSQRRQVSILVCGLVAAAQNSQVSDPEERGSHVAGFHRMAADVAVRFGGYVGPISGDSVHIYFGYPTTHEDDVVQAVRTGMALVDAAAGMGSLAGVGLMARAGIATGTVVVTNGNGAVATGRPVAIGEAAARAVGMQTSAAPGQVVVSQETRFLLGQNFDLRAVDVTPPGQSGNQPGVWQVCGERDWVSRHDAKSQHGLAALVGREEEFDLLLRRWEQAKKGSGRVVLVSGEPGIGKSRIAEDLLQKLDTDRPTRFRFFCSRLHSIRPLHPFVSPLESRAGVSSARSPAEKQRTLKSLIGPYSSDPARDVALLSEALMLPADARYPAPAGTPAQKREMVLSACLNWFEGLAAQRPIVILFEDIHWIDPTSLDLLDRMIAHIAHLPVLLIITMRPEHQPIWVGQPHVTMLSLNRLDRHDSSGLVAGITQRTPFPKSVIDQIVDHADGVPLFVSELTKHLMESGLLESKAGGHMFEGPLDIPTTLHSSLIARLDRLGEIKEVAMVGSAIGREFSHALMASVLEVEPVSLNAALERMMASGLISRKGTPPNASYSFTHILMCDAAYGMMLKDQRRQLHSKIADELIGHAASHPESSAETVAHHLSSAGRTAEAIQYWVDASRAAQKRWANRESADFLDLALEGLKNLPESRETLQQAIDLRFEMKKALTPLGEFGRVVDYLIEARTLIEKLDDQLRYCQFCTHMCQSLDMCGKSREAIQFGQEAENLAASLGDDRLLVEAKVFLGAASFTIMDYPRARNLFLQVLQLVDASPSGRQYAMAGFPEITACAYLTKMSGDQGDFDQGIKYGEDAVRRATALSQPYSQSITKWGLADLYLTRGRVDDAIGLFEQGLAVSKQWDLPIFTAAHSGSLGLAYALTGRAEEGVPLLEQAVAVFDKMKHYYALSLFLVPLAQASVLAGKLDQANDLAHRALALAQETGHRSGEAGALHLLAEAAARSGHDEQAQQHYTSALNLAEKLEMRPLAAHCHNGLGNIQLRLAEVDKARESFSAAARMYREMAMWFWLEEVDGDMLS